jgi:hypothetical protein
MSREDVLNVLFITLLAACAVAVWMGLLTP